MPVVIAIGDAELDLTVVHLHGLEQGDGAAPQQMAIVVAERDAHDLPDHEGYLLEQLAVEQSIAHHWPDVYEENVFGAWLYADMARMHTADQPLTTCAICAAIEVSWSDPIDAAVNDDTAEAA